MDKLASVNAMLQRLGKNVVSALDTDGTSVASYAERAIDDAMRQVQQRGWHFNSKYDVEVTANESGQIDVSALEGSSELYYVDTYGDDFDTDVVRQGNFLYDRKEQSSTSFTGTIKLEYIYDVGFANLPAAFQDWVIAQAALNYNKFYGGDRSRDIALERDLLDSRSRAVQDETRVSDINVLETEAMRQVRGRPRMQNRSVY
tara:strand:+ start:186 stop:791 length:606 start_codon:yes stop_codon:yes gene_type:complete